jgi:hypothetical protein
MINEQEIKARLDIIKALESLKFRIVNETTDVTYEVVGYKIYADSCLITMNNKFVSIHTNRAFNRSEAKEHYGELAEVIYKINEFIKVELGPYITEQKNKIRVLL